MMNRELKVFGTLLEFDCVSHQYGTSVTMTYKAVVVGGQAEQQLTITDASGRILERRLLTHDEHITPEQIKQAKEVLK